MRSAVAGCVAKNPPVRAFGLREPRKRVQHRLRRVSRAQGLRFGDVTMGEQF
jgi:hypothetical protein